LLATACHAKPDELQLISRGLKSPNELNYYQRYWDLTTWPNQL
jgi:hypothetical protein